MILSRDHHDETMGEPVGRRLHLLKLAKLVRPVLSPYSVWSLCILVFIWLYKWDIDQLPCEQNSFVNAASHRGLAWGTENPVNPVGHVVGIFEDTFQLPACRLDNVDMLLGRPQCRTSSPQYPVSGAGDASVGSPFCKRVVVFICVCSVSRNIHLF